MPAPSPNLPEWIAREHAVASERIDNLLIPPMTESDFLIKVEGVKALYVLATVLVEIHTELHAIAAIARRLERGKGAKTS